MLEVRAVDVRFGPVHALRGVSLTLQAGRVHALVGENGAGKSTLIKVLTGVQAPSAGGLVMRGSPITPRSPMEAARLGIACVHQEIPLVPDLSLEENVTLGAAPGWRGLGALIHWGGVRRRAQAALARVRLGHLDASRALGSYPAAVRQLAALARALDQRASLVILDEPTSSLDRPDADRVLSIVTALRNEGLSVLLVTHTLPDVWRVADEVTVLRDGALIATRAAAGLTPRELVEMMVGRHEPVVAEKPAGDAGAAALVARGLRPAGGRGAIDIRVGRGEVVGLAGLLGSGRTRTLRALFGAEAAEAGGREVGGRLVRGWSPRGSVRAGLAMLTEDRRVDGIFPGLSVRTNLMIAAWARGRGAAPASWRWRRVRKFVIGWCEALRVKAQSIEAPMGHLSGGNQQKVLLARWLATEPACLLLDEPTRGIDIGAKADVVREVAARARGGMGVLVASSEPDTLLTLAHRGVVLGSERAPVELTHESWTERGLLGAMAGDA